MRMKRGGGTENIILNACRLRLKNKMAMRGKKKQWG
jgi:hypothetical protein